MATDPPDRHVRRGSADYAELMLALLPYGQAWPRSPESTLTRVVYGLADYYGFIDARAADLLERESDPRRTIELLSDWERAWGLPDPCFPAAISIGERQKMLVLYMTWLGGQSRDYYKKLMALVGFPIREIGEFAPFTAGISQCGDTRPLKLDENNEWIVNEEQNYRWYIGRPEMRFYWSAHLSQVSFTWFRASVSQAGVDPHLRIGVPADADCLLRRWKPAHTELVFDFTNMDDIGPMEGAP